MRKQQILFFTLALIYFLYWCINEIQFTDHFAATSVIPVWHTTLKQSTSFANSFTPVYFLSIGLIYGLIPPFRLNKTTFWFHLILSLVPLLTVLLWHVFFPADDNSFNLNSIMDEYRMIQYLDIFFVVSQAVFVILLIFKAWKTRTHSRLE